MGKGSGICTQREHHGKPANEHDPKSYPGLFDFSRSMGLFRHKNSSSRRTCIHGLRMQLNGSLTVRPADTHRASQKRGAA